MAMTVRDLQEKLKHCPPDAQVSVEVNKTEARLDVGSLFVPEGSLPLVEVDDNTRTGDDIPF